MDQNKTKIKFTPIHQGMGFHPFSDGLPYAPESKSIPTALNSGTGAVTAGKPQFSTAPAPKINFRPSTSAAPKKAPPVAVKVATQEPSLNRRRFFAYFLDTVLHAGFWLMVNLVALFSFNFQLDVAIFSENTMQFAIFFLISQWLFVALQEMLFENTLGKAFFNLEFEKNHRSLLVRSWVFFIGIAFFGLGFFFKPQDKLGRLVMKNSK